MSGKFTRSSTGAESASSVSLAAVSVGAGEAGVYAELDGLTAEFFLQIIAYGIISFTALHVSRSLRMCYNIEVIYVLPH